MHRTAAWKRLRDLEAFGVNAELSIPNSGSRRSLAARWVDDGGDAGAGVRGVVGAPGGGCVCGPPPGTRAQGGGFTRDRGAWPPPCGLLCGDAGERRPGDQAVPPWCHRAMGALPLTLPAPGCPAGAGLFRGPGRPGPARLGGLTTGEYGGGGAVCACLRLWPMYVECQMPLRLVPGGKVAQQHIV